MVFNTCIKVKRKGFNYYTDYISKYFEDTFSKYGFHVVKNPLQSEFSLFMIIDDTPWMTIVSNKLETMDIAMLHKLSNEISDAFKSSAIVETCNLSKLDSVIEFHFSSKHSAFEEPAFICEGETIIKWNSSDVICQSGKPFILSCSNYGGISRGLEIVIAGDFVEQDTINFDSLKVYYHDYTGKTKKKLFYEVEPQKIIQSDGKKVYFYDYSDFIFPEGINPYSAKLMGKKGDDERNARSFYIYMIPYGNQSDLNTMFISIRPKSNKTTGVQWHQGIPSNIL